MPIGTDTDFPPPPLLRDLQTGGQVFEIAEPLPREPLPGEWFAAIDGAPTCTIPRRSNSKLGLRPIYGGKRWILRPVIRPLAPVTVSAASIQALKAWLQVRIGLPRSPDFVVILPLDLKFLWSRDDHD